MDQTILTPSSDTLYERDFAAWAYDQAERLRAAMAGGTAGLDWENLAEEIEALARRDRREVASHVGTIAEHLMKLIASPALEPRAGWTATVARARGALELILNDSPSLRTQMPEIVTSAMPRARRDFERALRDHDETPLHPPATLDFEANEIVSDWWPTISARC